MRLLAQLIVGAMLLTGVGFAKQPKYRSNSNYYGNDYRWGDRDYRSRSDGYRNYRYRDNGYRYDRYGNGYNSYRNLPPGIQKKLRRGGSLPPGHAKRMNRSGWYRDYYGGYYR